MDRRELVEALARRIGVGHVLELPREGVRQVGGVPAELDHRQHVGLHRVADHEEAAGLDADRVHHPPVGRDVLLGHDLDPLEPVGQPRPRHLGLLVEQVALGHDDQPAARGGHLVDHLLDAVEQLDRVVEQPLAQLEDGADLVGRDPPLGQHDGGLDERQGERLGPVAVEVEVLPFGGDDLVVDAGGVVDVRGEQRAEPLVGVDEVALAVPERVVAVERHDLDAGGAAVAAHVRPPRSGGRAG